MAAEDSWGRPLSGRRLDPIQADRAALDRRLKQIREAHPGWPLADAERAAREEIDAVRLAIGAKPDSRLGILRLAKQLRSANLALDDRTAADLARKHVEADRQSYSLTRIAIDHAGGLQGA